MIPPNFLSEQDFLQCGAEDIFFAFAAEVQALDALDIPLDIRRLGVGEIEAEYAVLLACLEYDRFELLIRQRPAAHAVAVADRGPARIDVIAPAGIVAHNGESVLKEVVAADMLKAESKVGEVPRDLVKEQHIALFEPVPMHTGVE